MNESFTPGAGKSGLQIHEEGTYTYNNDAGGEYYQLNCGASFSGHAAFSRNISNPLRETDGDVHWVIINAKYAVEPEQEVVYFHNNIEYRLKVAVDKYNGVPTWGISYKMTNIHPEGYQVTAKHPPAFTTYLHYTPKK